MKTYSPKASEIQRDWYIVDAEDQTLGRISTHIASVLKGTQKPVYATHMDMGDYVVVVNAEKIRVTGNKETQKLYYRHSQFPGGFRSTPLRDQLQRHPTRPLEHAVRNMLPKNALGDAMFKKLKVYAGPDHPHTAQKPQPLRIEG
jgi:large subunit ribosomal protein L13